jgi:hypothetical protein
MFLIKDVMFYRQGAENAKKVLKINIKTL